MKRTIEMRVVKKPNGLDTDTAEETETMEITLTKAGEVLTKVINTAGRYALAHVVISNVTKLVIAKLSQPKVQL